MYDKRRITKKVLAIVMSVVMLFGVMPVSALAAKDVIALRSDAPAPMLGSGNGLAMWAGEKLAGGVVSSISGYGANQAMSAIFGTQTDRVLQSLEEVKAGIRDIKNDIANMSAKLDQQELKKDLNDYGAFINQYVGVYDNLSASQTAYANDADMTRRLYQAIYGGKDDDYKVGGITLVNATINLGNELTRTYSDGYNIFGAYDLLDKFTSVWEHQGYDRRETFRLANLNIYMMYSSMSQLACKMAIESNPGSDGDSRFARSKAEILQKQLMDNADEVNKIAVRCAVIRHPDLRIARDIKKGNDLCAFKADINVAYVTKNAWGDETAWADFSQSAERYTSVDYLVSMTNDRTARRTPWSQGWEVYTNQPTPAEYKILLDNYDNKHSLYEIFFDTNEGGNFNNVGNKPAGLSFLCNHYVSRREPGSRWINWESNNHVRNNGQVYGWWKFSSGWLEYDGRIGNSWFDHANAFIVNKYLGEVKQGSLQGPLPPDIEYEASITGMGGAYELPYADTVTLQIDKTGDAYQWSVNKNDENGFAEIDGETNKTYTLPTLEAAMNGWQYSCTVIDKPTEPEPTYTYAVPVTLNITGDGISAPVTEHEVGDAAELKAALDKVDSGEWDQHTLKLTEDITYPNPITLDGLHIMTIDLNGYTLTIQPGANAEPNVNPMSNNPQIAAICLNEDNLAIKDSSGDDSGVLNIVAGSGIAYGVYAANRGILEDNTHGVVNVTSTGGGTAVYADGDASAVRISGGIQADGDNSYGIESLNWSTVVVGKDVTVSGKSSCGAYVTSFDGGTPYVNIKGDLTVSGEKSRAVFLDADTQFIVSGSVTVTDGREGVTAGKGFAMIGGSVTAPNYAINAWGKDTRVEVSGNVSVTRENAVAVSAVGSTIKVTGDVTSSGNGGIGILAATWVSPDDGSEQGATVITNGKIGAVMPLLIESTPVTDENERASTDNGYNVFAIPAKGTSSVYAEPGAFEVKATSLVTFDKNGGDTEASPNAKEVITGGKAGILPTVPTRSGYSFNGWNTLADGSGTAFTADTDVTGPISVYAQWLKNHSSDSSSDKGGTISRPAFPAVGGEVSVSYTYSNGTATLSLPVPQVNEIIEKSKGGEVVLDLSKVSGATAASIPKDALTAFSQAGLDTTVKLPVGTITLGKDAAASVAEQASGSNVSIELKQADSGTLTPAQKETVKSGDIVLDINITFGTKKITAFDGTLTVSMPYTGPQPVAVWYLNDKGELEKLSCTFKNGMVSFDLDHLSLYVMGQDTAKPAWKNPFTDVKEADWFYGAVRFCAEKGITNGTSATTFSPDATLTRGQFITMLLKAYGIEPISTATDNFADAGNTYYTDYLAAAKAKGISNGVGENKFAPDKAITRQEMFTLLYNALKVLNKLPTTNNGKTLADFTDSGSVAAWARDAMTGLVKSGTVAGSGGKLDPMSGSTRAQMAQVLYNLLGK